MALYIQIVFFVFCFIFDLKLVLMTCLFFVMNSEDRSSLNKLVEAVKTNFNERADEVKYPVIHVQTHFTLVYMPLTLCQSLLLNFELTVKKRNFLSDSLLCFFEDFE